MSVLNKTGRMTGKMVAATKSAPSNTKNKMSSWKLNFQNGYLEAVTSKNKDEESVLDPDLPL